MLNAAKSLKQDTRECVKFRFCLDTVANFPFRHICRVIDLAFWRACAILDKVITVHFNVWF